MIFVNKMIVSLSARTSSDWLKSQNKNEAKNHEIHIVFLLSFLVAIYPTLVYDKVKLLYNFKKWDTNV